MKVKLGVLAILLTSLAGTISAQQNRLDSINKTKSIWDKKFYFGATFNNCLVKIEGDNLPEEYFWKPALGVTLRTEYYFHKNIGVSVGFGYQQKGLVVLLVLTT
jgi:hypothetical protein